MSNRWQIAQKAEVNHWIKNKEIILSPEYRKQIKQRAQRVENWLKKFIEIKEDSNLLETGGGATQLIDFFEKGQKYALDPLADIYLKEFSGVLAPEVKWTKGKNEALPYPDNFFDIIISRNVLDHVDSVDKSLSEIHRVLNKEGLFYFSLNTFSGILYLKKLIMGEKEHPVVFTPNKIKSDIRRAGFQIIDSILDAPENMSHFGQLESKIFYKRALRKLLLKLKCYHFSEFILKK